MCRGLGWWIYLYEGWKEKIYAGAINAPSRRPSARRPRGLTALERLFLREFRVKVSGSSYVRTAPTDFYLLQADALYQVGDGIVVTRVEVGDIFK